MINTITKTMIVLYVFSFFFRKIEESDGEGGLRIILYCIQDLLLVTVSTMYGLGYDAHFKS